MGLDATGLQLAAGAFPLKLNGDFALHKKTLLNKKSRALRIDPPAAQESTVATSPQGRLAGESEVLPLSDLPLGCSAVITTVAPSVAELMDLGFIPGTHVTPTYSGPRGDPRVYDLDGSPIALRRASAQHIGVNLHGERSEGDS
jgi:ferrous iron transport protein A